MFFWREFGGMIGMFCDDSCECQEMVVMIMVCDVVVVLWVDIKWLFVYDRLDMG